MYNKKNTILPRRKFLILSSLFFLTSNVTRVFARTKNSTPIERKVRKLLGNAKVIENKVRLKLPEIASHGNRIPIIISVENPMTPEHYVEHITLLSSHGSNPVIGIFRFSHMSGKAEIMTYVRADTNQEILALAKTNMNKFYIGRRLLKVSIKREF